MTLFSLTVAVPRSPGCSKHGTSLMSAARAPLAARLDAAEAGRSVAALAAERSRQTKRAVAAAPARASFAAAFAGIGGDDVQQSLCASPTNVAHLAETAEHGPLWLCHATS